MNSSRDAQKGELRGIGVSHGVQMVNAVSAEIQKGADSATAAHSSFRRLLLPGGVALLTDTIGFLTILLIEIRIIQELALTASLGVLVIILTGMGSDGLRGAERVVSGGGTVIALPRVGGLHHRYDWRKAA